ncbi:MAG: pilus assembly protein N-terminal domain-containing protein [Sulfuricurvum sp.]|nr:pilus assembly protein N-terminal domain-containing protein [Sulfuricurvum sp.]
MSFISKYLQSIAAATLIITTTSYAASSNNIVLKEQGTSELSIVSQKSGAEKLTLFVGESTVLDGSGVLKVFVSNPDVARVNTTTIAGHSYMVLTAKQEGYCDLIRMGKNGPMEKVSLTVSSVNADPSMIGAEIRQILPDSNVDVRNEKHALVVSGSVENKQQMDTLLQLLSRYSGKIDNQVSIGGVKQIKLEARIIEMSRTKLKEAGINLLGIGSSATAGIFTAGSLGSFKAGRGIFTDIETMTPVSDAFQLLLGVGDISAVLSILESKGITKTLSRPSITTEDKKAAKLFVGGSIPIPVPQAGSNVISIEWKDYGIKLDFVPDVTKKGDVRLKVQAEAGDLSPNRGVSIAGTVVPAIDTRRIDSEVTLGEGEELVIAGLMFSKDQNTVDKVPLLGDIPVIGAFFKKAYDSREELELIVVLQPTFVSPEQHSSANDSTLKPLRAMEWSEYLIGSSHDRIE